MSSAARARFNVSSGMEGSDDVDERSGEVCERIGGGGRCWAGVSEGVRAPW
jgi:hypothetical protein